MPHAVSRLVWTSLFAMLLCLFGGVAWAQNFPSFEQVRGAHISTESWLLDRSGQPLALQSFALDARQLEWVPLTVLSPAMRDALLAAEDRRFFQHSGVDWQAFVSAAVQNLWGRTPRGASTLTMQLAGLLDPNLQPAGARRSYGQKWDQSLAARELEQRWSKLQILEAYLNLAPFRGRLKGIGAASEVLFELKPQALTRREAVILAALLRGPNASPEIVAKRACQLAEGMRDAGACPAITKLATQRLQSLANLDAREAQRAPHLARQLLRQPGQRVRSSLDGKLQSALSAIAYPPQKGLVANNGASVLVLDNQTGQVLVWLGGRNGLDPDGVLKRRSVSGAIAPQLAARALDSRSHTAASLMTRNIDDSADVEDVHWISLRTALNEGQTEALRGLRPVSDSAPGLPNLYSELDAGVEQASLALGLASESSLLQMANAWRSLPAAGVFGVARGLPDTSNSRRVFSAEAAYLSLDMLGRNAAGWHGPWHVNSTTGNGQIFLGSNTRYSLALAVDTVAGEREASHLARARALWDALAAALPDAANIEAAALPDKLVSGIVYFEPPVEAPRRELFLPQAVTERSRAGVPGARIAFPRTGNYTIGPEPAPVWVFEAGVIGRWQLNGRHVGEGQRIEWTPTPGRYQLRFLSMQNAIVLDGVDFEIGVNLGAN